MYLVSKGGGKWGESNIAKAKGSFKKGMINNNKLDSAIVRTSTLWNHFLRVRWGRRQVAMGRGESEEGWGSGAKYTILSRTLAACRRRVLLDYLDFTLSKLPFDQRTFALFSTSFFSPNTAYFSKAPPNCLKSKR